MTSLSIAVDGPYDPGILQPDLHGRLVQDITRICETAGIRPRYLTHSMQGVCTEEEIEWVRSFNSHEADGIPGGLYYVGLETGKAVDQRMMAMAGALIRNFIDARVMTVHDAVESYRFGRHCSVLLIPNFYIGAKKGGGVLFAPQVSVLCSMIDERFRKSLRTVLYVENENAMEDMYGTAMRNRLKGSYATIKF